MQLSDLAGVFSRHFVVGFFVPAFFALAAGSLLLTPELLPNSYERYDAGTRLLILGGVSIPVGLLLQGFHPAVLSSLSQHRSGADWYRFVPSWLYRIMLKPQRASFDKMTRLSEDADAPLGPRLYALAGRFAASVRPRGGSRRSSEKDHTQAALRQWTQTTAAARLEERFPPDPDDLVPTELGNTLLATQHYAYVRWGLDTWVAWPRLEALLTEEERGSLSDRKAEVAFFLNGAIASAAVGGVLIVDAIWHSPIAGKLVVLYGLPFLLA